MNPPENRYACSECQKSIPFGYFVRKTCSGKLTPVVKWHDCGERLCLECCEKIITVRSSACAS